MVHTAASAINIALCLTGKTFLTLLQGRFMLREIFLLKYSEVLP